MLVLTTGGVLASGLPHSRLGHGPRSSAVVDRSQEPVAQARSPLARAQPVSAGAVVRREEPPPVVPNAGTGQFRIAAAPTSTARTADLDYTVEVERPLPFSPAEVADEVDAVLTDPRGWGAKLGLTLRRVDTAPGLRILLATPSTTDALCAPLDTAGRVSCRNGSLVVLNAVRWLSAVPWYAHAVPRYRTYVVNHEVGHALGKAHEQCPAPGSPAPVMQQQTYGLQGCRPSVWPSSTELQ